MRFIILIAVITIVSQSSPVFAFPTQSIEQQVNLVNSTTTATSNVFEPVDNSLGFIRWDDDAYNNATVDFEAILACVTCVDGAELAKASLFDDAGNEIPNISVTTSNSSYSRVRVTDIGQYLSDNGVYTVKILRDADSGTAMLKTARLIIRQSSTEITLTQTAVNIGNRHDTTSTNYELLANPKIFYYNQARMSQITSVIFQATLSSDDEAGTTTAALSANSSCSNIVTGSEINVIGTDFELIESGNLTNNLNPYTEYWICLKTSSGATAQMANAHLIITQEDNQGIDNISLYHHYNANLVTESGDYTLIGFNNQYNPATTQGDRKRIYLEVGVKTDAHSALVELYNTTNNVSIPGSEITASNTNYSRYISNDLTSAMPSSAKDLDLRLKNTNNETSSLSFGWLIIHVSETPEAAITFTISGVDSGLTHNDITTSIASSFNSLPFGDLTATVPRYAAHQLFVSTNAASGYTVTVKMQNYMQGNYPANNIDPFSASWSSPVAWFEPNGTTPNDNTGWIGANTTDNRVNGWSNGAGKFGPVNTTANPVMTSTGEDAGSTVVVTYAIETNIWQPADLYSGQLIYNLHPTY